jgi:hypothetical protein
LANRIIRYDEDLDDLLDGNATRSGPEEPIPLRIGREVLEAIVEDKFANRAGGPPRSLPSAAARRSGSVAAGRARPNVRQHRGPHARTVWGIGWIVIATSRRDAL